MTPRLRHPAIRVATLACIGFAMFSALRFVGWSNVAPPSAGSAPAPIAFDDYALQYYYGRTGARFLAERGVTYGYDPSFMAGYVKTPLYYPSSKPFELALRVFSGCDPARVFNLSVFALFASLPVLLYLAARHVGLSPGGRLGVVALGAAPHLMVPIAGFYPFMEAAGMAPFILASYLALLTVALLDRFLASGGKRVGAALLVVAPLLGLSHPTAPLLCALPVAILYLGSLRRTPPRRHAWLWLVAVAVVLLNWPWLEGYLRFGHYADVSEFYTAAGRRHFVPAGGWLAPLRVSVPSPAWFSLTPPVFGALGLAAWWREGRRREVAVFAPQIGLLFVLSYYGSALGLAPLAPGRITLPLGLFLLIPAGHGLAWAAGLASRALRRRLGTRRGRVAEAALAAGIVLAALLAGLPGRVWRPYSLPRLQLTNGYDPYAAGLSAWIRDNTDATGRVLHEETDRLSHQYYGSHLAALLPLQTGREFANGPAPHPLVAHNFLRFVAGRFRGRPLSQVPVDELRRDLELYNVRWVVCWRPDSKLWFDRLPEAVRIGDYDKFSLYRIEGPSSFFLRGTGRLEVRDGRIELRDVVPEDGVVAIKYHWLESLRSDPPLRIEPLVAGDDPMPFLSVVDPPPRFSIYDGGPWAWRRGDAGPGR